MPTSPDPLAEAFAELPALVERCTLGALLHSDETSDLARGRLQAALDAPHVPISWIVGQFRATGIKIGKETVGQHRGGACRCTR